MADTTRLNGRSNVNGLDEILMSSKSHSDLQNHQEVSTSSTQPTRANSAYPQSRITLVDRCIDQPRALKIAVIGGGLAGVLAGILLPAKVPNIELIIYDKNKDFVSRPLHDRGDTLTKPDLNVVI